MYARECGYTLELTRPYNVYHVQHKFSNVSWLEGSKTMA